jgi:hypothetical protein
MGHIKKASLIEYAEPNQAFSNNERDVRHLENCPRCFAEASEWSWLFQSLRLPELESPAANATRMAVAIFQHQTPVSFMRRLLARVVFDTALSPEPCGIRGSSQARQLRLCGADADIHLRISAEKKSVVGQILRASSGDFMPGASVRMVRGQDVLCAAVTDDLGQFDFNYPAGGKIRFEAELPSGVILETSITVEKTSRRS